MTQKEIEQICDISEFIRYNVIMNGQTSANMVHFELEIKNACECYNRILNTLNTRELSERAKAANFRLLETYKKKVINFCDSIKAIILDLINRRPGVADMLTQNFGEVIL